MKFYSFAKRCPKGVCERCKKPVKAGNHRDCKPKEPACPIVKAIPSLPATG